ncbi:MULTISPECIES: hypothetical protein [unclassified Burkholderia]|uniref:hypothetical protein n=1 Tax=unclassified Burkholderia TaxID=2613784 RepID=UPI000A83639A|nr:MULTISPECIES: hypothetical protein [unclassified Burkholderia]
MDEREMKKCAECGMSYRAGEYHPYAACLMFMACHNGDTVRGNLQDVLDTALRTIPDRDAGLEDAAVLMEQRAAEIEACGNMTAHTMALIYRDEAEKIRALKTTPTAASREKGNG